MYVIEIYSPDSPDDLKAHRWYKIQCFVGKCAKLLRDTDQQSTASEKIVRPFGVIDGRTYCLEHLFEEVANLTGTPRRSILELSERKGRRRSIID